MGERPINPQGAVIREYQYKAPLWIILSTLFVFGLGAFICFHEALNNSQGLILKRRFSTLAELSPNQSTIFFWVLGFFSLAVTVLMLAIGVSLFTQQHRVLITANGIIMPKSLWSSQIVTIPFSDITNLQIMRANGAMTFTIFVESRKYIIIDLFLRRKGDFDEMVALVSEATGFRRSQLGE
ncbi:MAG: hypothetical protein LRZ84_06865 [Desertifilum sp.]|nr:hypothetical protein [Desertifilum sp.]